MAIEDRARMDDPRWEPGMPVLERQAVRDRQTARDRQTVPEPALPPSLQGLPPRSVPEVAPTPLQAHYISLSVVALLCGVVAITALEAGVPLASPLVKSCVLVGAPFLVATTLDATIRIWRSAWAWMPVDRGRGLFRLAWVAATLTILAIAVVFALAVLLA